MPEGEAAATASAVRVARFIRRLAFDALPVEVVQQAQQCLLDALGVAAAGAATRMSKIARHHAATQMRGSDEEARILFDGRSAAASGAAFAGASTIDAFDAHDGHVLTKGHAGAAVVPSVFALCDVSASAQRAARVSHGARAWSIPTTPRRPSAVRAFDGGELLTSLVVGYEIATRAGIALHRSVADYHCSGAWNALGCAALASRALVLDDEHTREALGIAEYFGTRGQMMRTCASPTMVKDGSGWGAHAGLSAAWLARDGFTGAPAITVEAPDQRDIWDDLGARWRILEHYFKAYPVCRWAQPAIEAAMALRRTHDVAPDEIGHVTISTFAEAIALGCGRPLPRTTEDAQYSLAYPVAAALVHGRVGESEVRAQALNDERVRRLLLATALEEDPEFSRRFPAERWARVSMRLSDGRTLVSDPAQARGGPENPLSADELEEKYFELATPRLGSDRAASIAQLVRNLPSADCVDDLLDATLE